MDARPDMIPKYGLLKPETIRAQTEEMLEGWSSTMSELAKLPLEEVTYDAVVGPYQKTDNWCSLVWGAAGHLNKVKGSEELRKVYNEILPKIVKLELETRQNPELFKRLEALKNSKEYDSLSAGRKRGIEQMIRDAKLGGLALEGDEKKEFNDISEKLSVLSTNFKDNIVDSEGKFELMVTDAAKLAGMPDHILEQGWNRTTERHPDTKGDAKTGPWCFTFDLYYDFMKYCGDRTLREEFYRSNITKASEGSLDNAPIIEQILKLRKRKAQLLGFKTHAELSLTKKMAPSVDVVLKAIDDMRTASLEKAKEEVTWLEKLAGHELRPWDVTYYTQQLKEKSLSLPNDLVNYFPLDRTIEVLFGIIKQLFKVDIVQVDCPDELQWDEHVRLYEVLQDGAPIARFFLDQYARPGEKKDGAWMASVVERHRNDKGDIVVPVAHIVCNASKPVGGKPALLSVDDAVTLFHECGHCLQHTLTNVEDYGVTGIEGVEWDACELPSQFMENWFYLKKNLKAIGRHWETGEPLSDEVISNLTELKFFCGGMSMLRQMAFASIDMRLHHEYDNPTDTVKVFDFFEEAIAPFTVVKRAEGDKMLCAFSHIFAGGYSAGYYSYVWAEILSSDAFGAFEDVGLDNTAELEAVGKRFRDTVLGLGGSVHPSEVFRMFRGRDPSVDALLRHNCLGSYPRPNPLDKVKDL